MTALRVLWIYLRIGVLNELEYRTNFAIQLFQSAIAVGFWLANLAIVFSHTETLAGWHPSELLALLGVYFLVGGLFRTFVQPSKQRLMEDVRQGTLDFTLTKPADSQLLVSVKQVEVPAEALAGRLTTETLAGSVALAAALLVLSRWFWTFGVRHYSGASA